MGPCSSYDTHLIRPTDTSEAYTSCHCLLPLSSVRQPQPFWHLHSWSVRFCDARCSQKSRPYYKSQWMVNPSILTGNVSQFASFGGGCYLLGARRRLCSHYISQWLPLGRHVYAFWFRNGIQAAVSLTKGLGNLRRFPPIFTFSFLGTLRGMTVIPHPRYCSSQWCFGLCLPMKFFTPRLGSRTLCLTFSTPSTRWLDELVKYFWVA